MKHIDYKIIESFIDFLFSNNIIGSVKDYSNLFSDEPKFFRFNSLINEKNPIFESRDFFVDIDNVTASGISFNSRNIALFKCLAESLERFCQHCYQEEFTYISNFSGLKKPALNPTIYLQGDKIEKTKFSWVKGKNLTTKKECLIPTQLVYLNFFKNFKNKEPVLTQLNSSGTAGGFTEEESILSAIFELVERDAFMGIYLNRIKPLRIDFDYINDKLIKNIMTELKRNYFKPYVFNITTDLNIPVFLAVIVDQTEEKPKFTLGAKCGFDEIEVLKGALEEAMMPRVWLRSEMLKTKTEKLIDPKKISSFLERALFWNTDDSVLHNLDFLLKQKPKKSFFNKAKKNENNLKDVIKILAGHGYEVYGKDISLPEMKTINYHVHRVIIPGLQPLYLDERYKEINIVRLKEIGDFYGQTFEKINIIPHPFL